MAGLKKQGIGMLVGLTIQYILGMTSNLFVQFPQGAGDGQLWEFAWNHFPTAAHIIVGLFLLIGGGILLSRAVMQKNRPWIVASGLGLLFIFIAGLAGSRFVSSQNDIYSYVMSLGFIGAFLSYGVGIYKSKKS